MKKLRLDRRLLNRRGWISPDESEREIAALPDVSDKIDPGESGVESEQKQEEKPVDGAGFDGA